MATRASKAKENGGPPEEPRITPDGVFIVVQHDEQGGVIDLTVLPQGDVRPAEIPTILEKACRVARQNIGLRAL